VEIKESVKDYSDLFFSNPAGFISWPRLQITSAGLAAKRYSASLNRQIELHG